jgi:hypothetical protein
MTPVKTTGTENEKNDVKKLDCLYLRHFFLYEAINCS